MSEHVEDQIVVLEAEIERLHDECRQSMVEISNLRDEITQLEGKLDDAHAEQCRLRAVITRAKDALLDERSTQWVHDVLVRGLVADEQEKMG